MGTRMRHSNLTKAKNKRKKPMNLDFDDNHKLAIRTSVRDN